MMKVNLDPENQVSNAIEILGHLHFGYIDAEQDDNLITYFVETPSFDQTLQRNVNLVLGVKGSGKSAIFRILCEKHTLIPPIRNHLIVPMHTPNSVFELEPLRQLGNGSQRSYRLLWKMCIALQLCKRLIDSATLLEINPRELQKILLEAGFSQEVTLGHQIGAWIRRVAEAFKFRVTYEGVTYELGFDFVEPSAVDKELNLSQLLEIEDSLMAKANRKAWILMDRLDEVGDLEERVVVLQGLMNSIADLLPYRNISIKIFLRTDIYNDLAFDNKDHFSDKIVNIQWEPGHLLILMAKRIVQSLQNKIRFSVGKADVIKETEAFECFYRIFPSEIQTNEGSRPTFEWLLDNLADGQGNVAPRDLLNVGIQSQMIQRDFFHRGINIPRDSLFSQQAVFQAFENTSGNKLNDYLYGAFPYLKQNVEKFRGLEKARLDKSQIREMLETEKETEFLTILKELHKVGFLRKVGLKSFEKTDEFEIPTLYHPALNISSWSALH